MKYRLFDSKKIRTLFALFLLFLAGTKMAAGAAPPPIPIIATPDTAYVNGYNGNANLITVFANDSFNSLPVVGSAMKVTFASPNAKITFDTLTGTVSVQANILAGTYTITYTLADTSNLSNNASANVVIYVTPPPIIANADYVAVNSYNGGVNVLNIFTNDSINNQVTNATRTTLTVLTFPTEPGIVLNNTNGRISVFPYTPAGTYYYTYRICDTANVSNCDTALVRIDVTPPPILANNDFATVNGYSGNSNVLNVMSNDSLNNKGTSLAGVNLSLVNGSGHPGVTLNLSTGLVGVNAMTPAGIYLIDYKICDTLNVTNCDTGRVTITVDEPYLVANYDSVVVNGMTGASSAVNILSNDSLNYLPVSAGAVNISILQGSGTPQITLNTSNGIVSIAPFTPAGNYTMAYKLCDTLNPGNCDSDLIILRVVPAPMDAKNDTFYVNGYNGTSLFYNVLSNDRLNADTIKTSAVRLTLLSGSGDPAVSLDTTHGFIQVSPNRAISSFSLRYQITDTLNPGNIDSALVRILVVAPPIVATSNNKSVNGYNGDTNLVNVLHNDSINNMPATLGAVKLNLLIPASHPGIVLNDTTGIIKVAPMVQSGLYTISYRICDTLNTSSCDTTIDSIYVLNPPLIATADSAVINGYKSDTLLLNVLTNDSLNGTVIVVGRVKLKTLIPATAAGIQLNDTTGVVSITPRVAAGNYFIEYRIGDTLNAGHWDTARVVIQVNAPLLIAHPDSVIVNGYTGTDSITNVLANDSINGLPAMAGSIHLQVFIGSGRPDIFLDTTNGYLKVLPYAPAGIFTITYILSDTLNPGNKDTTHLYIEITHPKIKANPDSVSVSGYIGRLNLINLMGNDSLNNKSLSLGGGILTLMSGPGNAGIVLNTTNGWLSVFPGTTSGLFVINYRVCDSANLLNCDTTQAKILVLAPSIDATNDTAWVNGYNGSPFALNAFNNDTFNSNVATSQSVRYQQLYPFAHPGLKLDSITGVVSAVGPIPADTFDMQYRICDTLNAGNCDTAYVVVFVSAPTIDAVNDTATVNGFLGSPFVFNVLDNDLMNGLTPDTSVVKLLQLSGSGNAGVVMDTLSGKISVAPLTAAGTYTIQYQISDTLNPTNRDTAWVILNVTAGAIYAHADSGMTNGYPGQAALLNVISNDTLNGLPVVATQIHLSLVMSAGHPGISLDTLSGLVSVAPRTDTGTYVLAYQIRDTLNPSTLDTGYVTVWVFAVAPVANPDTALVSANSSVLVFPLLNDFDVDTNLNPASLKMVVPPLNGIATVDTINGTISYTPSLSWVGYDTVYYSVCDSGMVPILCDTSYLVILTLDSMNLDTSFILNAKCYGDSNGTATLLIQGGLMPYSITWNTVPVQTGSTAINLKAGNYLATVTDSLGNTLLVPVSIGQPLTPIAVNNINTSPNCYGEFTGKIKLSVSGGNPKYTYFWNTGSILDSLDKLAAGTYTVTVTDSLGCSTVKNILLSEPAPLGVSAIAITDVVCKNSPEGSIQLFVSGGVKPYRYVWSTLDTSASLQNIPDGNYKVLVTDSHFCQTAGSYNVYYSKDNCESNVFTPQGFSPDGDGINDAFSIEGIDKYPNNHLRIYNRWGGLVFEEHGYKNTWKGTFESGIGSNSEILPTGTYFYVLELEPGQPAISGYTYISK